jgi:hypothetical protein
LSGHHEGASHPPSHERVAANQRTMAEFGGPGGDLGRDRYMAAIGGLKNDAPAYQKFDDALKAAGQKDYATARRLTNEAIKAVPRESRFYGLLGELDRTVPQGQLGEERDAARVIAHCQLGSETAEKLAADFSRRHPASAYLARMKETCPVSAAMPRAAPTPE